MSQGWIKVHRKLRDNPLFTAKKSQWLLVWMWLLMSVNHKSKRIIVGTGAIVIEAGSVLTSRDKIAKATGVNRSTVERCLKYLENEHQIEQHTTRSYRIISIPNWKKYQSIESALELASNQTEASRESGVSTNKNEKNEKKDENGKKLSISHKPGYREGAKQERDCLWFLPGEIERAIQEFGKPLVAEQLDEMDAYVENNKKGQKYKNHYKSLVNWCRRAKKSNPDRRSKQQRIPDEENAWFEEMCGQADETVSEDIEASHLQ